MVLEFLDSFFLNPLGLIALVSLIPLIIIYLIKEKPKVQFFPSVRFLVKRKKNSFLPNISKYIKDPLFIIQILILIILCAAIAKPYINVPENAAAENVLIILDVSGSMQATHNGQSRLDVAKSIALENIGDANTIILASEFPEILSEKSDNRQARRLLETVKPKDTPTNLYDAIILADDFVDSGDVVVIISDFIHTSNDKEIKPAIDVIRSKGIKIVLENVVQSSENVGIVDLILSNNDTRIRIKNYNNKTSPGQIRIGSSSLDFSLEPFSSGTYSIAAPAGTSTVDLNIEDDFSLDNKVYVSRPRKDETNILYITNNKDLFLYTALSLIDGVKVDLAEPPVINSYDYDVFVIKNVDSEKLVPSIIQNINDKVASGSSLIVAAGDYIENTDMQIFGRFERRSQESKIPVNAVQSSLTADVEFGTSKSYFVSSLQNKLAEINSEPIIAYEKKGSGNILFYGLIDESSTFQYELYYPVFWKRILSQFVGRSDVKSLGVKTGSILANEEGIVVDPDGNRLESKSLIAEKTGFYSFSEKTVSANLIDEKESDINGYLLEYENEEFSSEKASRSAPKEIVFYVLIAAFILIFLELLYIKFRGDL